MSTFAGKLLIASPSISSGSKRCQSVIYVFQDSDEGTVGITLNKPANESVREVWSTITDGWDCGDSRLSIGGPLSGPVLAVHRIEAFAEIHLSSDLFAAASQENLKQLTMQDVHPYRVFFGLSGWKPGELSAEIESGKWLTAEVTDQHIFGTHDDLWRELLREMSTDFLKNVIQPRHIPESIYLN